MIQLLFYNKNVATKISEHIRSLSAGESLKSCIRIEATREHLAAFGFGAEFVLGGRIEHLDGRDAIAAGRSSRRRRGLSVAGN